MNSTSDVYRMNPAEDTLVYGDELEEGMWVLADIPGLRVPSGDDEDSRLRAQRFRRVKKLRRQLIAGSEIISFLGEWVDGYQQEHKLGIRQAWIVKKAPADAEAVTGARKVADMCRSATALGLSPAWEAGPVFETPEGGSFTIVRGGRAYTVTVTPAGMTAEGEGGS